jgi:predicted XRE-type DNA-binding protein
MSNAPIKTPEPTVDPECPETDWNPARRIVRRLKGQRRVPSHLTLADLRETAEVTQAEMAKRLGTHQTEISRLERRPLDRVSIGILRRYAAALGARVEVKIAFGKTARSMTFELADPSAVRRFVVDE